MADLRFAQIAGAVQLRGWFEAARAAIIPGLAKECKVPYYADWFVGAVSIAVGVAAIWNVFAPHERLYELPKIRFLEKRVGRSGVRFFLTGLGLAMIALGVAIALGYTVRWDEQSALWLLQHAG